MTMKTHEEAEFLEWADSRGMRLDPRWPDAAMLSYHPDPGCSRFWMVPAAPELRPHFLATLLELVGEWRSMFVWRHMGSWPGDVDHDGPNDPVEFQILRGLGMPLGTAAIVEFARDEGDKLVTLLFSTTVFGWSVGEDLFVVPDHSRCILQTSHHGVVHVTARDQNLMDGVVSEMADAGFPLPDDPPDPTFKRPEWMGRR